jgi:hypothetical protein
LGWAVVGGGGCPNASAIMFMSMFVVLRKRKRAKQKWETTVRQEGIHVTQ